MEKEYSQNIESFFALLRAGLYGTDLPAESLPSAIDWEWVVRMAKLHSVLGVVIEGAAMLPEALRPPAELYARMQRHALRLIHSNMGLDRCVGQLVLFLEAHGVNGVLLKGQGTARAYRVPEMRHTGDIDFYVGREQYRRVAELCQKHLAKDPIDFKQDAQHFSFSLNGVSIEVHQKAIEVYSPLYRKEFKRWMADELENSPRRRVLTIANTAVMVPSVDFDAVYIFYHALHHFITGGIGLRQLCDWAMIFRAYGDQIDINRLKENIERFGLKRPWTLFAGIAVDYLGVSKELMPFYNPACRKKYDSLLQIILDGGNFGVNHQVGVTRAALDHGVGYAFTKLRYVSRNLISTLPVMPAEAVSFYIWRLYAGAADGARRLFRHK